MHKLIVFISFFLSLQANAQQWAWEFCYETPIESGAIWTIDEGKQLYIFQQQNITKFDKTGKKMLVQSFKTLGDISSIDANNQLKIAIFSEEQQQVCYLDNALALSNECIDLSEQNVEWANLFTSSNQTDRFWIFDQVNNELRLLSTSSQQKQTVQNLKQVSNLGTLVRMFERNNNLYLIDDQNQLAQFDIFGTLINTIQLEENDLLIPSEQTLFGLRNGVLINLLNFDDNRLINKEITALPEELKDPIVSIASSNDIFFFATKTKLSVFKIKP